MINAAPRLKMGRWHILPRLNCYVHRHVIIAGKISENNQIHDLLEGHLQENGRSQTDFRKSNGEDSPNEETIENDPRDMYFILRDWNQIWQLTQTGFPIYSSNYPGGIFRTDEGYEFELEIYPKEICRKIFLQI